MLFAVVVLLAMLESPVRLGVQALERRDFAAAALQLEQAVQLSPGDASVWVLLAQARAGAGQSAAALAAAAKAEEVGAADADVHHGLAFFYSEFARDYLKAATLEAKYARARPAEKGAWSRVAALYVRGGAPEQAIEPAVLSFREDPNQQSRALVEDIGFRVSQARMVKQDFKGAVATLERVREVAKDSAQVELSLGVALYGQRKFAEAVGQFLRTMQLAPDVEQPYVFAGKILEHAGDRMPALLEQFEGYRRRNPESHLGYLLTAKVLVSEAGDPQKALAMTRLAIAKKNDDPEAHFLLGTLLEGKGELAAAAAALERSVALRDGSAPVHYRLARVYLKLGRTEDAAKQRAIYERLNEESAEKLP